MDDRGNPGGVCCWYTEEDGEDENIERERLRERGREMERPVMATWVSGVEKREEEIGLGFFYLEDNN